jgi:hypothetical protein
MPKAGSVCFNRDSGNFSTQYERIKAIIAIAKKNGWEIEGLGLIPKILPIEAATLTNKQIRQRDKLIKSILEKYSRALTPPVPSDLEKTIRSKTVQDQLPWEKEVLEKMDCWRNDVAAIRPLILGELRRALGNTEDIEEKIERPRSRGPRRMENSELRSPCDAKMFASPHIDPEPDLSPEQLEEILKILRCSAISIEQNLKTTEKVLKDTEKDIADAIDRIIGKFEEV